MIKYQLLILVLLLSGCKIEKNPNIEVDKVLDEIKDFKIKQLSQKQILDFGLKKGKEIANEILKKLDNQKYICGYSKFDNLTLSNRKIFSKININCSDNFSFGDQEKKVREKFENEFRKGEKLEDQIKIISNSELLFSRPFKSYSESSEKEVLGVMNIILSKKELIRAL